MVCTAAIGAVIGAIAEEQPGSLDASFEPDGSVLSGRMGTMALQKDGCLLLAESEYPGPWLFGEAGFERQA